MSGWWSNYVHACEASLAAVLRISLCHDHLSSSKGRQSLRVHVSTRLAHGVVGLAWPGWVIPWRGPPVIDLPE